MQRHAQILTNTEVLHETEVLLTNTEVLHESSQILKYCTKGSGRVEATSTIVEAMLDLCAFVHVEC